MHDVLVPAFKVEIRKSKIDDWTDISLWVESIKFTDEDGKVAKFNVKVANPRFVFTDHELFEAKNRIRVSFGYIDYMPLVTEFVISKPVFDFPENQVPTIALNSQNKTVSIAERERRVTYRNVTDTALINLIFERIKSRFPGGCQFEVIEDEGEEEVYDLSQINQTDYEFLRYFCRRRGYDFYVNDDAALIIRPMTHESLASLKKNTRVGRLLNSKNLVVFKYYVEGQGTLQSFKASIKSTRSGSSIRKTSSKKQIEGDPDKSNWIKYTELHMGEVVSIYIDRSTGLKSTFKPKEIVRSKDSDKSKEENSD